MEDFHKRNITTGLFSWLASFWTRLHDLLLWKFVDYSSAARICTAENQSLKRQHYLTIYHPREGIRSTYILGLRVLLYVGFPSDLRCNVRARLYAPECSLEDLNRPPTRPQLGDHRRI